MSRLRHVPLAIVLAFVIGPAPAQTAAEHAQHKAAPAQPSAQSSPSTLAQTANGAAGHAMAAMDEEMKAMHAMHEKSRGQDTRATQCVDADDDGPHARGAGSLTRLLP